jgi:hypothetical protein
MLPRGGQSLPGVAASTWQNTRIHLRARRAMCRTDSARCSSVIGGNVNGSPSDVQRRARRRAPSRTGTYKLEKRTRAEFVTGIREDRPTRQRRQHSEPFDVNGDHPTMQEDEQSPKV